MPTTPRLRSLYSDAEERLQQTVTLYQEGLTLVEVGVRVGLTSALIIERGCHADHS